MKLLIKGLSCVQYEEVADKDDLMGVEDTAKKGILWRRAALVSHRC